MALAAAALDREHGAAYSERVATSSVTPDVFGSRRQLRHLVFAGGLGPVPASSAVFEYPEVPRLGRERPLDLDCPPERYALAGRDARSAADASLARVLDFAQAERAGASRDAPTMTIAIEACGLERLLQEPYGKGRSFEEVAWVAYRDHGAELFRSAVGLRLHGGGARQAFRKGFRLYFRPEYGARSFVPGEVTPRDEPGPRTVVLEPDVSRDSDQRRYHFVNPLAYDLAARIGGVVPQTKPVALVVNGTPLGAYVLTERMDEDFVARRLPHPEFDLVEGKGELPPEQLALRDESLRFVADATPFDLDTASRVFDVDSLFRWFAVVAYGGTADAFQGYMARDRRADPPIWRMIHWDLDWSFQKRSKAPPHAWQRDLFNFVLRGPRGLNILPKAVIYRALTEDPAAQERFVRLMVDTLNHEWSDAALDELLDHYELVAEQLGVDDREYQILLREYADRRDEVVLAQLQRHLGAGALTVLEVEPGGGTVLVDGRAIDPGMAGDDGSWKGRYFEGMHAKLEIPASERDRFAGFELDGRLLAPTEVVVEVPGAGRVVARWKSGATS